MATATRIKKYTMFRPKIRSRHPSHSILRKKLPLLPFRSVIRLGSTTVLEDVISNGGNRVECNSVEAIKNSSDKLKMKKIFTEADVNTAKWCRATEENFTEIIDFPIVAKNRFGSRGRGNTKIDSMEQFEQWRTGKDLSQYILEKFHNYGHEFRLHISEEGCFYTCRKAIKQDTPEDQKWRFHDDTCVWFLEENEKFFKPNSWEDIVDDCVEALKAIGADVLAFDVKVQSPTKSDGTERDYQDYILLESNSAPSLGDITSEKYIEFIPKILKNKYGKDKTNEPAG